MFRHLAFAAFLVAFAAFAFAGLAGWARTRDVGPRDETPLKVGYLQGTGVVHDLVMGGNPWRDRAEDVTRLKRDLPPDPWGPDADDEIEKANRRLVHDLEVPFPAGRYRWPEVVAKLKEVFEHADLKVSVGFPGTPDVPSAIVLDIPNEKKWTGFKILTRLTSLSEKVVAYDVTSEGLCIGTDEAVKALRLRATLKAARRRVEAENADEKLDVPFRPDLLDAKIEAFARAVTAQTGIEVVVDSRIWEAAPAIRWRGEPRSLRDALKEICAANHEWLHAFWRYHDGRIWLLRP